MQLVTVTQELAGHSVLATSRVAPAVELDGAVSHAQQKTASCTCRLWMAVVSVLGMQLFIETAETPTLCHRNCRCTYLLCDSDDLQPPWQLHLHALCHLQYRSPS